MRKGFRILMSCLLVVLFIASVNAQEENKVKKIYNEDYDVLPMVKRLSYENFRNIKLLQTAIYNYEDNGKDAIEALVDQYAEASALYFQNRIVEAANKFTENEKAIKKAAKSVATKFKKRTNTLVQETIKMNIKHSIKKSLRGEKENKVVTKYLKNASHGSSKANDLYVRSRFISSIYYYRRAKENAFAVYSVMEFDKDEKKNQAEKDKLMEPYKKDVVDNRNKIYRVKEKHRKAAAPVTPAAPATDKAKKEKQN
ncbi:MAG: hypothetical protein GY754_11145 [bacterium]|nr:hypothetical protein [bacterium]